LRASEAVCIDLTTADVNNAVIAW